MTCSWEPGEKNGQRISGAEAAGPGAGRPGGAAAGPRPGLRRGDSIEEPAGAARPQSGDRAPLSSQNGWEARQCSAIFGLTTKGPRKM